MKPAVSCERGPMSPGGGLVDTAIPRWLKQACIHIYIYIYVYTEIFIYVQSVGPPNLGSLPSFFHGEQKSALDQKEGIRGVIALDKWLD